MKAEDAGLDTAFTALADPTRRAVVRLLQRGPLRAGELAAALDLSPPGLSRHLRVLRHAGLIADDEPEHDLRVRLYRLEPAGFAPLRGWIDELETYWSDQLDAFKAHAEAAARPKPSTPAAPAARARRRR